MIILRPYETKILIPIPMVQWREPSQFVKRDQLGNPELITRFILNAKTHDGVILWSGIFKSRDDFDAFLFSLGSGKINQEKALWNLPTPNWPELDTGLVYEFLTQVSITQSAGSASTYTVPNDYNSNSNGWEGLGAGGSGTVATGFQGGYGGASGCFAAQKNIDLSRGVSTNIHVGGVSATDNAVATTYLKNNAGTTVLSAYGTIDRSSYDYTFCIPNTQYNSGTKIGSLAGSLGGDGYVTSNGAGGGGGGALASSSLTLKPGGSGTFSSGGTGGAGTASENGGSGGSSGVGAVSGIGGDGGNATDATTYPALSGGGGGGGASANNGPGGKAGNYGAGGGGSGMAAQPGGSGAQGKLLLTYTPLSSAGFNMPFLGM